MLGTIGLNITVLLTSVNTMLLCSCCTCWFTVTVSLFGNGRAGIGIRDDGIAAITAMISWSLFTVLSSICTTAKSRLRVDIIDWLDFTFARSTRSIDSTWVDSVDWLDSAENQSTRSIDSIDLKVYFAVLCGSFVVLCAPLWSFAVFSHTRSEGTTNSRAQGHSSWSVDYDGDASLKL